MTGREADEVRRILRHVGGGQFSMDDLREDARLSDELGLDSLRFVTLVLEIEERLGRKVFNIDNLPRIKTVGDLLSTVHSTRQGGQP